MRLRRKIVLSLAVVLCATLGLLMATLLLALRYINSTPIKSKIETEISRELGGTVRYQRLDISIYPQPHVVFHEMHLSIPKNINGTVKFISIYPKISPLLKGKLFVSRIRIHEPDLTIVLPETVGEVRPEALSLPEVKKNIRLFLGYFQAIGPGLVVDVARGRIVLMRKGHVFLSLRDAGVRFNAPPGAMDIMLKANTELWGAFSLKGRYSFGEEKTEVKDLSISMGRSSISDFSASLAWTDAPYFDIASGRATLALDEIYQWLSSAGTLTTYLEDMKSISGALTVSSVHAHVPLNQLSATHATVTGEASNVVVDTAFLPAPLSMTSRFVIKENRIDMADLQARMGESSLSHVAAFLAERKKPVIGVLNGTAVMNLTEIFQWLRRYKTLQDSIKDVKTLTGTVNISSMNIGGPLFRPAHWNRAIAGNIEQIKIDSRLLPGPLIASQGTFSLDSDKIMFDNVRTSILDTKVTGSGTISGDRGEMHDIDLRFTGTAGTEGISWAYARFALPKKLIVNAPLVFTNSHLVWQKKAGTTFVGEVNVANGPALSIDLSQSGPDLVIKRATIKDQGTDTIVSARQNGRTTELSFSGKLAQNTLNRIFKQRIFGKGNIQGDLHTTIHMDRIVDSTLQGTLSGDHIVVPWGLGVPLSIDKFSAHADNNVIIINSAALSWGKNHYAINGNVTSSDAGIVLDMNLDADNMAVSRIQQALYALSKESKDKKPAPTRMPPILGRVHVNSSSLLFGRYTFKPSQALVTLSPHEVSMAFTEAKTCDISILGTLDFLDSEINFNFKPSAAKQPLESSLTCLAGRDIRVTGTFDLKSDIRSQGKSGSLVKSLEGEVDFVSNDGEIYYHPVLAKIFSVLSVLAIFRGKLPDLGSNGFPFYTMVVKGKLHKGKFELEKSYIDGMSLDIVAQGEIDLASRKMDLIVLVAPFPTINWIIGHTPLLKSIMGGTLISVPVKVSGDVSNPDVTFLAPSAVGTQFMKFFENILELPVELISPILPKEQEKQD
jgi:AsmA-like protein